MDVRRDAKAVLNCLESKDFEGLLGWLRTIYAAIPHSWYRANLNAEVEGYYLTMLVMHLNAVGAVIQGEDESSRGQSDLVVRHAGEVFVIEAKVIKGKRKTYCCQGA